MITLQLASLTLAGDGDVVAARRLARATAEAMGLDRQAQTRFATAVSEIARNAVVHGLGGQMLLGVDQCPTPQRLLAHITDHGPGIDRLDDVLGGRMTYEGGFGKGLSSAQRLVDEFDVKSDAQAGTRVELAQRISRELGQQLTAPRLASIARKAPGGPVDTIAVLHEQNREIAESLQGLKAREDEAERLNRELDETNRGVVALYSELDDKAEQLRQVSDLKSRFLSHMSHEFRTPLSSILALARLLADGVDGELNTEQGKQVEYIRRSAQGLLEMVNDLLDLAKVEAGKLDIRPGRFRVSELFGSLRGALKPLQTNRAVELVFEDPGALELVSDESKVSQILRNFVSNALKFTERGRVTLRAVHDGAKVELFVEDTGIGIADDDQRYIFEEFAQIEHKLQKGGTGLGLSLSRRLAQLLGGTVDVRSQLGVGSTFWLSLPAEAASDSSRPQAPAAQPKSEHRLLVVDDEESFRYVIKHIAHDGGFAILEAPDGQAGLRVAREQRPDIIVLDLQMPLMDGFDVLAALSADPILKDTPVIVCSSLALTMEHKRTLAAAYAIVPKHDLSRDGLTSLVRAALSSWYRAMVERNPSERILVVDDEVVGRYAKSRLLRHAGFDVLEAGAGLPALELVEQEQPALVLLDVRLPDISGIEVCKIIKAKWSSIMVLQTSATYVSSGDRTRGLDGGADSYLTQPIDSDELVAAIRALLRLHAAEESVRALNSSLEQRISERTEDLRNANALLVEQMAQRERAEAALVQSQKLEAVGQLTGVMAHDFNNVLAATKGYLHLIAKRAGRPEIVQMAEKALGVVLRGSKLTSRLLAFARTSPLRNETVDVNEVLLGMEDWLNHSTGQSVRLIVHTGPTPAIAATDPHQLELAVLNLCINSRDAMPGGGDIEVRVRTGSLAQDAGELRAGEYVVVSVVDNGPGMPQDVAARAFEPFFTTKPSGRGTGLGMAQVHQFARQSNGAALLTTAPGQGTQVELWLPAADASDLPTAAGALDAAESQGTASVLVVDDDPDIRHTLVTAFEARGYQVACASGGLEALRMFEQSRPDAMVLDVSMPDISGIRVALSARNVDAGVAIVFMSGNADTADIEQAVAGAPFVRKPFDPAYLMGVLERTLRAAPARG